MAGKLSIIKQSRLEEIAEYLGQGLRTFQIIDKISDKWCLKPRQSHRLIHEAKKWIQGEYKEDREKTRIQAINRYQWRIKRLQELPEDSMSERDREALIKDYLKQIDDLEGNKLPERHEISKLEMKEINITIAPTKDMGSIERKKQIKKHYQDRNLPIPDGFKRDLKKVEI